MFNNRFNSSKRDPLVEAVEGAMKDGELRRQAIAHVNEQFGVFNRNAVIREELAAYDAAIEEAYKCMKEGKPLADKDYDKDGKIESPKDEVWGSRFRAAKLAGKMEEGAGVSGEDPGMAVAKQAGAAQQAQTPSSTPKRTGNAAGSTISNARGAAGMNEEEQIDEVSKGRAISAYRQKEGEERDTSKLHGLIKRKFGKETAKHAERAGARDAGNLTRRGESHGTDRLSQAKSSSEMRKTKSGKIHGQDVASKKSEIKFRKSMSKFDKKGHLPEEVMKESIKAKLLAKHMKEETQIDEVSAFGQAFRAAGGKNFTFGGKEYSGARADAKSSTPTPPSRPAGLGASKSIGDAGYKSGQTVSLKPIGDTGSAMAADNKPEPARPAPTPGWKAPAPVDQSKTIEKSGGTAPVAAPKEAPLPPSRPANLGGGEAAGLPKIDTGPKLNANKPGLQESVQVGENKYRIF